MDIHRSNVRKWQETKVPEGATIIWYNQCFDFDQLSNFVIHHKLKYNIDVGYAGYRPTGYEQWNLHFWFIDPAMAMLSKLSIG